MGIAYRLHELLQVLAERSPTPGNLALLKALVEPIVSVERSRIWFDDRAFHIQHYAIGPGDPAWATRGALLARVKESLANNSIPLDSRLALWGVLAHAHKSINLVVKAGDQTVAGYEEMLAEDLRWARTRFTEAEVIFAELAAARELWHWHYRYGPDNELKALSSSLESLYTANDLAAEFEPLLRDEDYRQRAANMSSA